MKKEKESERRYFRIFVAGLGPTENQSCVGPSRKWFFSELLDRSTPRLNAKVLRPQCRLSDPRQTIGLFVGHCPKSVVVRLAMVPMIASVSRGWPDHAIVDIAAGIATRSGSGNDSALRSHRSICNDRQLTRRREFLCLGIPHLV
jgi:hypothetical protein